MSSWREWRPSGRDSVVTPVHGGEEEGERVTLCSIALCVYPVMYVFLATVAAELPLRYITADRRISLGTFGFPGGSST